MACDNTAALSATRRAKSWRPSSWRLHTSTYIIGGVIAAVILLANVPGRIVLVADPDAYVPGVLLPTYMNPHIDHGWPWTFVRRGFADFEVSSGPSVVNLEGDAWDYVKGINPSALWTLTRTIESTSWLCLVGDVLAAGVVLAVGVGLFEVRRRRSRLFQIRAVELIGLGLVWGLGLIWFAAQIRHRNDEQYAMRHLSYETYLTERAGPHWLRQLVGPRWFRVFDHVAELHLFEEGDSSHEHRPELLSSS